MKKAFFGLGLLFGMSAYCGSLMAADMPPAIKASPDTYLKIKNLKNDRAQLKLRAKTLRDSASRKLTKDWLGYRMIQQELTEIEKQIQEIDAKIQGLEKQKQPTGS